LIKTNYKNTDLTGRKMNWMGICFLIANMPMHEMDVNSQVGGLLFFVALPLIFRHGP
jgi:hypothetical protein